MIYNNQLNSASEHINELIELFPTSAEAELARDELKLVEQKKADIEEKARLQRIEKQQREIESSNKIKENNSKKSGYYNSATGEKQKTYRGSTKQKEDLKAIDEYARNHPGF